VTVIPRSDAHDDKKQPVPVMDAKSENREMVSVVTVSHQHEHVCCVMHVNECVWNHSLCVSFSHCFCVILSVLI